MSTFENQDNSGEDFDPNDVSRRRKVKADIDSEVNITL